MRFEQFPRTRFRPSPSCNNIARFPLLPPVYGAQCLELQARCDNSLDVTHQSCVHTFIVPTVRHGPSREESHGVARAYLFKCSLESSRNYQERAPVISHLGHSESAKSVSDRIQRQKPRGSASEEQLSKLTGIPSGREYNRGANCVMRSFVQVGECLWSRPSTASCTSSPP